MSTHVHSPAETWAPVEWVQADEGGWELREGHATRVRLAPGRRIWVATTPDHAFTLQRVGFHRPRIVVRPFGALAEIAHVQHDWRGLGTLCLASGPCLEIDRGPAAGLIVRDTARRTVARLCWTGRTDPAVARVHLDAPEATGRFGPVILLVAGYLLIEELGDPSRPRSIGALGPTVRSRFA